MPAQRDVRVVTWLKLGLVVALAALAAWLAFPIHRHATVEDEAHVVFEETRQRRHARLDHLPLVEYGVAATTKTTGEELVEGVDYSVDYGRGEVTFASGDWDGRTVLFGYRWLEQSITLGLDLQGGTHMVLEVDLPAAVTSHGDRVAEGLRRELEGAAVAHARVDQTSPGRVAVSGIAADAREAAEEVFDLYRPAWDVEWEGDTATLVLDSGEERRIKNQAARQVKDTIERRINEFGVREPTITLGGDRLERIVLQLPGLDDVERVKDIITRSSVLEFRLGLAEAPTEEDLLAALGGTLPEGAEIVPGSPGSRYGGLVYALERVAVVRGEDLLTATSRTDEFGQPAIGFTLGREGTRKFGDFTGRHVGDPLAVVLDGHVVQYATIRDQIFSSGIIAGSYTIEESQDAALTLRSGALPAKVSILFEQTVGPSLGRESIEAGLKAALFGLFVVVVFMLAWYQVAGINAVLALGLNLLLVLGFLSLFGAVLTLPGIAGLILTIGMAVDANVIIFERIKEELAVGKSPQASVQVGFEKAFSAIFDANVTTLLAAFFLFNFGTGPIKGFAVTLSLGILCSMFTALLVSRWLFELRFQLARGMKRLLIQWTAIRRPLVPFMRWRAVAAALSLVALASSIGFWMTRGLNYGIDFLGGTQVVVKAAEDLSADDLRARLAGSEFAQVPVQSFGDDDAHEFIVRVSGAERAVATTTVNAPEGGSSEGAASRLIALLSAGEGIVDLNTSGRRGIQEVLVGAGSFPVDASRAAAEAIVARRTETGGLLAGPEALAELTELPGEIVAWLGQNASFSPFAAISTESVGPAIGAELKAQARRAVIWSLLAILLYISLRFRSTRFGVAAIVALSHDVLITIGLLAVAGVEFNISIIAALLTIVGYSLNDTIVVFDRVRENMRAMRQANLATVLDTSISQTLSRSLLTSGTTLLVTLALLLFGGPVLKGFALALTLGVIVGTYSSVFIASPVVLLWEGLRARRARRAAAT